MIEMLMNACTISFELSNLVYYLTEIFMILTFSIPLFLGYILGIATIIIMICLG